MISVECAVQDTHTGQTASEQGLKDQILGARPPDRGPPSLFQRADVVLRGRQREDVGDPGPASTRRAGLPRWRVHVGTHGDTCDALEFLKFGTFEATWLRSRWRITRSSASQKVLRGKLRSLHSRAAVMQSRCGVSIKGERTL